jgi:hypothetical protein
MFFSFLCLGEKLYTRFNFLFHCPVFGGHRRVPRSNVALKIVKATGGRVALEDLGLSEKLIEKIKLKQQKLKLKMERDKARREEAKRLKEATSAGFP